MNRLSEWDINAEYRHKQIVSGIDISYHNILLPTIEKLIGNYENKAVIDVGCGTGYLTAKIAKKASFVLGLDPSKRMFEVATREYGNLANIKFENDTVESYARSKNHTLFSIAISNMSLITMPNLVEALKSISSILSPDGIFAFNVTHPCFYNDYRKLQDSSDFDYMKPHKQKGKFLISNDKVGPPSPTTHFHRPLQEYVKSLREASFIIDELLEPFPSEQIMKCYPKSWEFPHFLSIRCIKKKIAK